MDEYLHLFLKFGLLDKQPNNFAFTLGDRGLQFPLVATAKDASEIQKTRTRCLLPVARQMAHGDLYPRRLLSSCRKLEALLLTNELLLLV